MSEGANPRFEAAIGAAKILAGGLVFVFTMLLVGTLPLWVGLLVFEGTRLLGASPETALMSGLGAFLPLGLFWIRFARGERHGA